MGAGRRRRRRPSRVVFTYLGPVVLDPVFNKFTPLPAGATRDDVLELAKRAGVDVNEVYEVDASRRTTAANAYVTGIGHTKRVVLYDTLLKDFTPAETRLVIAHELGHVHFHDVPHGLLWLALVAPFGTLAIARASERMTRPGTTAVPAVALSLALIAPVLTTISNQLSRDVERRADAFALELTHEPDAMVAFERRITLQNVGDPDPPRWQQIVLGTHPPTMERIGQALAHLRVVRPVPDLRKALDAFRGAPLGPVVVHGVHQLAASPAGRARPASRRRPAPRRPRPRGPRARTSA